MKKIVFYEVLTDKDAWRGSYSIELNSMKNRQSALEQAIYNAKTHGGNVFAVDVNGEREKIYPLS